MPLARGISTSDSYALLKLLNTVLSVTAIAVSSRSKSFAPASAVANGTHVAKV
ncbi:hypothetical protein D3C72_2505760 [compost metagenome]